MKKDILSLTSIKKTEGAKLECDLSASDKKSKILNKYIQVYKTIIHTFYILHM